MAHPPNPTNPREGSRPQKREAKVADPTVGRQRTPGAETVALVAKARLENMALRRRVHELEALLDVATRPQASAEPDRELGEAPEREHAHNESGAV